MQANICIVWRNPCVRGKVGEPHFTAPEVGSMRAMQLVSQMLAHTSPSTHSSSFSAFTACPLSCTCIEGDASRLCKHHDVASTSSKSGGLYQGLLRPRVLEACKHLHVAWSISHRCAAPLPCIPLLCTSAHVVLLQPARHLGPVCDESLKADSLLWASHSYQS